MCKTLNTASIAICLLGLARIASAQDSSGTFRPFGGLFADMFSDDSNRQQSHPLQHNNNPVYSVPNYSTANGQGQHTPTPAQSPTPAPPPLAEPPSDTIGDADEILTRPAGSTTKRTVTSGNYSFQWSGAAAANPPQTSAGSLAGGANPSSLPMYERLKQYRDSPFSDAVDAVTAAPETPTVARNDLSAPRRPRRPVREPPAHCPRRPRWTIRFRHRHPQAGTRSPRNRPPASRSLCPNTARAASHSGFRRPLLPLRSRRSRAC